MTVPENCSITAYPHGRGRGSRTEGRGTRAWGCGIRARGAQQYQCGPSQANQDQHSRNGAGR